MNILNEEPVGQEEVKKEKDINDKIKKEVDGQDNMTIEEELKKWRKSIRRALREFGGSPPRRRPPKRRKRR